MANKQISDLQARTFDGDSIIAHDVENTDPSTMSQKPYLTGSATGHAVADFVGNGEIYTTDLNTVDKHINGAINELHAINGYSYDAYDDTATYAVGDLCIYNNTLYKCTTAITTAEAWNASHWTATSIADEIGRLQEANTYDNTERIIGSFYGSNLYRKCFVVPNITIPRNSFVDIDISDYITGNIRLLKILIVVHTGTDFIILPYSYANQANQKYEIGYAVNQNQITLSRGDSSDITAQDVTVVAEYIEPS